MINHEGLRFNEGKIRHDLLDPFATEQLARVFTFGSKKYAPNNWRKGMAWSNIIASLKRHLSAIEQGQDYDPETGLLHAAHVAWNAHALTAYYKIYPQGDDRPKSWLNNKRIGLDIDDVLADWVPSFCKEVGAEIPKSWFFGFREHAKKIADYNQFMLNLPVKTKPEEIPFEPVCYITNRKGPDVPIEIAQEWLRKNGFPQVTVIQSEDKMKTAKEMNLDIFVDDKYDTFVKMNEAGILCYLYDCPHNQRYDVGHLRIKSLKELA